MNELAFFIAVPFLVFLAGGFIYDRWRFHRHKREVERITGDDRP